MDLRDASLAFQSSSSLLIASSLALISSISFVISVFYPVRIAVCFSEAASSRSILPMVSALCAKAQRKSSASALALLMSLSLLRIWVSRSRSTLVLSTCFALSASLSRLTAFVEFTSSSNFLYKSSMSASAFEMASLRRFNSASPAAN